MIAIVFGFLWIRDVTKPVRTPPPAVQAGDPRADSESLRPEEEPPKELVMYPRNTFLSAATLGLGGVIGGVTLPVLGFAVLPSFTNQEDQDVVLGPSRTSRRDPS